MSVFLTDRSTNPGSVDDRRRHGHRENIAHANPLIAPSSRRRRRRSAIDLDHVAGAQRPVAIMPVLQRHGSVGSWTFSSANTTSKTWCGDPHPPRSHSRGSLDRPQHVVAAQYPIGVHAVLPRPVAVGQLVVGDDDAVDLIDGLWADRGRGGL